MSRSSPSGLYAPPVHTTRLIAILGLLAAFAPLATDMYLPAFHQMALHFGVPEGGIEVTLSMFFLGLAAGQAIYGPLIDRWGRRGPLLAGIGLYTAATALCLSAADIGIFTGLRFLQAAGGAAGMIVGRAIVSDLFDAREGARALSTLMAVMTLGPILSPILGGFIIAHAGWRTIFLAMLAFGLLCITLVWRYVPETLPPARRQAQGPGGVLRVWLALLATPDFVLPALVGGLAQACMFAFITGSPFVFMTLHGVSAQGYGWLFALIASALVVFSQLNRGLLRRFQPGMVMGPALVLNCMAGLGTLAAAAADSLPGLLVALWLAIGALGLIGANAAATAMAASRSHPGSGSSLVGVLQFGFAFLVSGLVAALQNGTAWPMTGAIAACGALASLLWFMGPRLVRRRL
ncbi:MAG: multidrug effflux MFS transporter [Xenophilus sp.]